MFQGRIGVIQYWQATIFVTLLAVIAATTLSFATMQISLALISPSMPLGVLVVTLMLGSLIGLIPIFGSLPFLVSLQVRRFHDFGLTGWIIVAAVVLNLGVSYLFPSTGPIVSAADFIAHFSPQRVIVAILLWSASIILACWPGTKGPNRFGEPVRYRSTLAAIIGSTAPANPARRPLWFVWPTLILLAALVGMFAILNMSTSASAPDPMKTYRVPISPMNEYDLPSFTAPSGWDTSLETEALSVRRTYWIDEPSGQFAQSRFNLTLSVIVAHNTTDELEAERYASYPGFTSQVISLSNGQAVRVSYDEEFKSGPALHYERIIQVDGVKKFEAWAVGTESQWARYRPIVEETFASIEF